MCRGHFSNVNKGEVHNEAVGETSDQPREIECDHASCYDLHCNADNEQDHPDHQAVAPAKESAEQAREQGRNERAEQDK